MNPFHNMKDWNEQFDRFFGNDFWGEFQGFTKGSVPYINLYHSENEVICYANLPGLHDVDDVNVYVEHSLLEIRGRINLQHATTYTKVKEEIKTGPFERKIQLPYPVRKDKINATYRDGLLVIVLHRLVTVEQKRNRIPIQKMDEE
ncbi:heat shock protein Hsp20 [Pontibacillus halophilus JSM 076056 = DSM 19796]|uniref:Heat shock protein Hsp20 n=1 Tax=Pontibacillus halophilus JSM 076056 = DSM 19796 TaxID=1385510 RepID=A0A0A5GE19_9BACI|nr:Hsp20/alpha crystallin family protein [Pontibacillus halophilus]KGX90249.1 heat shock protein Hsp20 [Pontibacillus halophilus JSM 076056 = DSM 19796]